MRRLLETKTPFYSDKTPFQKNKTAFRQCRNAVLQKDFGNYGFVFGGVFAIASANGEGCFFSADGFRAVYIDFSYYRYVFFGEDFDLSWYVYVLAGKELFGFFALDFGEYDCYLGFGGYDA